MKPIIGMTLDCEDTGGYASVPWYALRKNYCESVSKAGGIPLPLPHHRDAVEPYVSRIDGLVLTGGGFDIPPPLYGVQNIHPTVKLKPERTAFEFAVARLCYEQGKPILGICGGMQLINVLFGGTLIQDIPSLKEEILSHKQPPPYTKTWHPITLKADSLLYKIHGQTRSHVNSVHHQAVDKIGEGLRVSATAPDDIVEGIEHTGNVFCVGVQWHPEYAITDLDEKLLTLFISSCKRT